MDRSAPSQLPWHIAGIASNDRFIHVEAKSRKFKPSILGPLQWDFAARAATSNHVQNHLVCRISVQGLVRRSHTGYLVPSSTFHSNFKINADSTPYHALITLLSIPCVFRIRSLRESPMQLHSIISLDRSWVRQPPRYLFPAAVCIQSLYRGPDVEVFFHANCTEVVAFPRKDFRQHFQAYNSRMKPANEIQCSFLWAAHEEP